MAGAKMVVGRGNGGLSTSGSGPGGGGTGYGHIYGAGNLDTGGRGTHGQGRGPKLAERGEHEVCVGLGNGGGETDGSLSKEQINKVVRAHLAGVKYCYEKELQHKIVLAGGVDIFWVIQPDGTVSKANVKQSTMADAAVEGCIVRQVKQWQFPKAPGQTIVGRYPVHLQRRDVIGMTVRRRGGRPRAAGRLVLAPCAADQHALLLRAPTPPADDASAPKEARASRRRPDAAVPRTHRHGAEVARRSRRRRWGSTCRGSSATTSTSRCSIR